MKLTKKLMALAFTGLLFFPNCNSSKDKFEELYGTKLIINPYGNFVAFGYDRDNDELEDLRLVYQIREITNEIAHLKLREIGDDENRNGSFEPKEIRKIGNNENWDLIDPQDQPIFKTTVKY